MNNPLLSVGSAVTAFDRARKVAQGAWPQVVEDLARYCAREPDASVLLFDDHSGRRLPWPVPAGQALAAPVAAAAPGAAAMSSPLASPAVPRAGRPRLGVVAREVTLLPEHWQWLATQPGGASAALRRLVGEAQQAAAWRQRRQRAAQAAFQCLTELAPQLEHVDEALAAVYTADAARFEQASQFWPPDWRDYVRQLGFPRVAEGNVHCQA